MQTTTRTECNVRWRKSTYSNGGDAQCVEVAYGTTTELLVRDSKNPTGPRLTFSRASFLRALHVYRSDC